MDGNTSGELRNLIRCLVAGGSFSLNLKKLRKVRRGEGASLLRTNLTVGNPEERWKQSIVLTEVEQALKELKNDLDIRPIYHQKMTGSATAATRRPAEKMRGRPLR